MDFAERLTKLERMTGGLVSYGPDFFDQYRLAAGYVARSLKGGPDTPSTTSATQSGLHQPLADDRRCYRRKGKKSPTQDRGALV
jgi:hypothetical protein